MIVIILLTLFAILGLMFLLYADAEATASAIYRDSQSFDPGSEQSLAPLFSFALGQLIYDVDDLGNPWSAMRGNSLARDMYGWNNGQTTVATASVAPGTSVPITVASASGISAGMLVTVDPDLTPEQAQVTAVAGNVITVSSLSLSHTAPFRVFAYIVNNNTTPFSGTGKFHTSAGTFSNPFSADDYYLPNYTAFTYLDSVPFVRDPERLGARASPTAPVTEPWAGGWNPSYTYPDANHMFLGAMNPNGALLTTSFHREFYPAGFGTLDPTNANWVTPSSSGQNPAYASVTTNPALKYMVLRPRPVDQVLATDTFAVGTTFPPINRTNYFPLPVDAGGDVKNLVGAPASLDSLGKARNMDSVWMDLSYPVQTDVNGNKYKALFAFYVIDLDGKINVNTAGNIRGAPPAAGQPPSHVSNQGWGGWEVNPRKLVDPTDLTAAAKTPEFAELLTTLTNPSSVKRRYGPNGAPDGSPWALWSPGLDSGATPLPGLLPHIYSQLDYDGCNDGPNGALTGPLTFPTGTNAFPTFPAGYNNGSSVAPSLERVQHPSLSDYFKPGGDDRTFDVSNMRYLLYNGYTAVEPLKSDLGQLMPNSIGEVAPPPVGGFIRNLLTTHSIDMDRPPLTPWILDFNTASTPNYQVNGYAQPPTQAAGVSFPPLTSQPTAPPAGYQYTHFTSDWRAVDAIAPPLGSPTPTPYLNQYVTPGLRVDLNRFLPPYPHMGQGGFQQPSPGVFVIDPTSYKNTPVPGFAGRFDADQASSGPIWTQFVVAQLARQQLADDIYRRLLRVTGLPQASNAAAPTDGDLIPRRWLAQLAVNSVDYIDEDDISTPFQFYNTPEDMLTAGQDFAPGNLVSGTPNPELLKYWVFGTELPRVVLNEALVEYKDPGTAPPYSFTVNVYAELANPLPAAPSATVQPRDATPVPLYVQAAGTLPGFAPYQLLVTDTTSATTPGTPLIARLTAPPYYNDNIMGTPNQVRSQTADAAFVGLNPMGQTGTVGAPATPSVAMSMAPGGFFLVGPGPTGTLDYRNAIGTAPVPATTPLVQCGKNSPLNPTLFDLQYQVNVTGTMAAPVWTPDDRPAPGTGNGQSVLLRRLANPYLPFNQNTNPYITIDYIDAINFTPNNANNPATPYASVGKRQPYSSGSAADAATATPLFEANQTQGTTMTKTSFGLPNQPAPTWGHYDWLVHLDRLLTSPTELLQVSGYHPHELTHQFIRPAGTPVVGGGHRVPWYDQTNRLYRIFELLETHDRSADVSMSGRIPGKVNVNTMWDKRILRALADAQPTGTAQPYPNVFTQTDVDAIWTNAILPRRSATFGGTSATGDQPFLGLGIGYTPANPADPLYPGGSGINNTLLAPVSGAMGQTSIFNVTGVPPGYMPNTPPGYTAVHPYLQDELLNKIFSRLTTRSNVFAVWCTVGFFTVIDDTVRPVKLGSEVIDPKTGAPVRHQLFAIIDRSNLTISPAVTATQAQVTSPGMQKMQLGRLTNGLPVPQGEVPWQITTGSVLVVDSDASQETVVVTAVDTTSNSIYAIFTKPHGAQAGVSIPGNPGPQPLFDLRDRKYAPVVPYWTVVN
jgi:hypothetical protein